MEAKKPSPTDGRQWWPLVLILLSLLPGLAEHLANLWRGKPHYQFFPLLLLGFGVLLWQRWPPPPLAAVPSRLAAMFLGSGLMVLAASVLVSSPWLAAVATLLTIAGVLFRLQGRATWRDWLPVWAVLWLLIPPPLGWDLLFIQRLQSLTSRATSLILDTWGLRHLMAGNVLILPGHRLLVDEACSGVNSTFVLLAAAALFVVAARRPALWSGLMLFGSIVWSALGNIVRVAAIAVAQSAYGLDWSTGWQHEVLGLCTFAFALWMVFSTDQLLAFLLGPIAFVSNDESAADDALCNAPFPAWDLRLNPLTRVWNWLVGLRPARAKRASSEEASTPVRQGHSPATGGGSACRWFAAGFVGVAIVQLATGIIPIPPRDGELDVAQPLARADLFERTHLPPTLAGWTQIRYATEEYDRTMGRFRHLWVYQSGRSECMISVDYPFRDWHDLSICYVGAGWQVDERRRWPLESTAEAGRDPYLEIQLSKPADERGLLLFCNVQQATGDALAGYATFSWQRIMSRVNHEPWWQHFFRSSHDLLQIQAFVSALDRVSSSEREAVHELFLAARQQLLAVPATRQRGASP